MLLQRSKLAATTVERPRLAPPWSIALIGALLLIVLVVIFPHQNLIRRLMFAPPGEITEAYLVNLLRTDPKNPELRLVLARSQLNSGFYNNVGETLAPSLSSSDPQTRQQATWLLWQSKEEHFRRIPANAPERHRHLQLLRDQLAQIAHQEWDDEFLAEIARKALRLGDIALGIEILERLSEKNSAHSEQWFTEAAHTALSHGEHRAAAELFLIARDKSFSLPGKQAHFMRAMQTMQAGNLIPEALVMAERELAKAPELRSNSEILELLVRFARAARRPDLADKYARLLLRLSLLEQWRRLELAARGFDAAPRRVALTAEELRGSPQLPFDDRIYTLGYEAFLDNRKLEDAWKVAASAVRQAPDNLSWRERLAKVSEWVGRPKTGLDNWLYIARTTGHDSAWQSVLRLAPGLFDDEALRAALQYQMTRQPNEQPLMRELAATYERLGDPQGGMRFLEQLFARTKHPWMLEMMAELAERMGDESLALHHWKHFLTTAEVTPARAVRVATLMLLRGQYEEGLALLMRAQAGATETDVAFWRLTAELASMVQNDETAIGAYHRVVGQPDADVKDYDALLRLLQDDYPREAAQVATAAWRRFLQERHLLQALSLYASGERWAEMRTLFAELDATRLKKLRTNPAFLQLSAQYRMNTGQALQARHDLETALRIAPHAPEIQQALLWLLIEGGDDIALRQALTTGESTWRDDPTMHDALGAAYLALSLPEVALRRYYTPHLAKHRDDFLWLMNYADALEQNQEADRAWQLRQHLLSVERRNIRREDWLRKLSDNESMAALRRAARTRLSIAQRPGDHGLGVMRELLRLDRDAERKLSSAAKDIALSWLQEHAEYTAERGWLWQQYTRSAARPLWAEITLALAEDDRARAGELLERHGERLPRYDRINAATLIGDVRRAQSDAFDTLAEQPDDDSLHFQLTEALLGHSDHFGGELAKRKVGTVDEREQAALWHLAISPDLSLDLSLGSISRINRDDAAIGTTPDETYRSARLAWRHTDGESRLTVQNRKSFDSFTPVLFEHEQSLDKRLSLNFGLGSNQSATESTALRVAGKKDLALIGLRYRPTQNHLVSVERHWENYSTQTGTELGRGQIWQFEMAYALRTEPRSLETSLFWSGHRYQRRSDILDEKLRPLLPSGTTELADIGPDFFLPNNFRYYGIRFSTDSRFEKDFTRAWRPYAAIAKTWHSTLGPGYDLSAGIAGSVFGADHLNFGWKLGRGGSKSGGLVREIGLTYRLHY